jgi:hypothetical protein
MRIYPFITLVALVLLLGLANGQEVINIMAMGQVGTKDCPVHGWFSAVPDIDYTLVVTKQDIQDMTLAELRRWIRIYLPRSREQFVEEYDHYVFVDSWLTGWESSPLVTAKQAADIKWSIGEGGVSVFATGIWGSNSIMTDGLLASDVEEYYPVDLSKRRDMNANHFYKVRVNMDPQLPEVLKIFLPLGLEQFQGQWVGQLYPKQGSTIWAWLRDSNVPNPPPDGWPWLVSWKVGSKGAYFWVAADDLEVKWWWGFYNPPTENPYGLDILANIIYQSLGKPLPQDILLLHDLRRRLIGFNDRKALALSVMEFAEKFKANTGALWQDLVAIEEIRTRAASAYLLHEYVESGDILSDAEAAILELGERAMRLKDTALLWVYVIEWLAVTAVGMVTGTVLWTLMVRRRLYREVKTTRGEAR